MTETETESMSTSVDAVYPRPRIRTGAVLWGLTLAAASGLVLWLAVDAGRRERALETVAALDGFGWTVAGVVTAGGILILIAAAAVIRRVQRNLARRDR